MKSLWTILILIALLSLNVSCDRQEEPSIVPLLTSRLWSLKVDCRGSHHTDEEYDILSLNKSGEYVRYGQGFEINGIWNLAENEDTLFLDDFKYQIDQLTETELELYAISEQCHLSFIALSETEITAIGVSAISGNSAIMHGKIRTSHSSVNVTFEYGLTKNYGNTTKIIEFSGPILAEFNTQISELIPDTLYHYRIKVTNSNKTYYSDDLTFRTIRREIVSDADGNEYYTVKIGTQIWMVENLKTTKYRNGDAIPFVISDSDWRNLTTGACCIYRDDESKVEQYGCLYNWYAVNDNRNIAPEGWHVATDADWTILTNYLGGEEIAGHKLKAIEAGGNNSSGFNALLGGNRHWDGPCNYLDLYGYWICAPEGGIESLWVRSMSSSTFDGGTVGRFETEHKRSGFSVRCVKDAS